MICLSIWKESYTESDLLVHTLNDYNDQTVPAKPGHQVSYSDVRNPGRHSLAIIWRFPRSIGRALDQKWNSQGTNQHLCRMIAQQGATVNTKLEMWTLIEFINDKPIILQLVMTNQELQISFYFALLTLVFLQ